MAETKAHECGDKRLVHETLIEVCDMLSECIATASGEDEHRNVVDVERVKEVNRRVWELRWELFMHAGAPISLAPEVTS